MALVVNDRVKETSTTTGTGTLTLDGAVTGFETFSSAIGNTNTTYYAIELPNTAEFEVGLGTVAAGTLARTTVISSSNSDALVDFSAGTKNVFCTLPASKAVIEDASNNVTLPADLTVGTDTFDVDSTNEKVSIGTTSGSYTGLNVYKKSGPGNIYVHLNGNPGTIIGTSLLSEGTSGDFIINTRDNADIRLYTNNTLRSEFKNNGNFYVDTDTLYVDAVNDRVGIGTTSPSTLLHLSSSDPQITITDTDGTGSQVIKAVTDDLTLDAVSSINLDADSGVITFKDGGTQFGSITKSGNDLRLVSSLSDGDLVFRGNDGGVGITALTLDMSEAGAATFNDKIILGANKVIEFGDAGETISGNGINLTVASSARLILDAATDLVFDALDDISIRNGNFEYGKITQNGNNFDIHASASDYDFNIKGNDGGSEITALTFDMSEAGAATFNSSVTVGANLDVSSGTIKLDGNYPTGTDNVALGDTALDAGSLSGGGNTAIGSKSLSANTTGGNNTAVGEASLFVNTTGVNNVAIGNGALQNNTYRRNTAVGYSAGSSVTSGENLTLLGYNAEPSSATATNEITLGDANVTSLRIPGLQSGASSGDILTYDGTDIGLSTPTFISNVVEDTTPQLGGDLDTNGNNINFGDNDIAYFGADNDLSVYHSGSTGFIAQTTGSLFIRNYANDEDIYLQTDDGSGGLTTYLTADGSTGAVELTHYGTKKFETTSTGIDVTGTAVVDGLTVAGNVSVDGGTIKLDGNYPTGTNNVALGDTAFDSVTSGGDNTAIGNAAGTAITTGNYNVVVGSLTGDAISTGSNNTAIGYEALSQGNSSQNTAVGFNALRATTGSSNIGIGLSTGLNLTTGYSNIFMGQDTGIHSGSSSRNIVIGNGSFNGLSGSISTCTIVGYQACTGTGHSGSNNTIIGNGAQPSSTSVSNEITLGDTNITSLRIPGLQSGASSGDVLTYDGTDITLSAPTGVSAGFSIAMAIAL